MHRTIHILTHITHLPTPFLTPHLCSSPVKQSREVLSMSAMRAFSLLLCALALTHTLTHSLTPTPPTAVFTPPAVTHQWRPASTQAQYRKTRFPVEFPLSEEMLLKGIPALTPSQLHRFLPLMQALSHSHTHSLTQEGVSRNVTIASLGGSFALGTQCCVGNSWPQRLVGWLRRAYPRANIVHLEYLKGSTNSLYGASVVRELFAHTHVDLLLMGYALNDEVLVLVVNSGIVVYGMTCIRRLFYS
jgi:hypothetical protein